MRISAPDSLLIARSVRVLGIEPEVLEIVRGGGSTRSAEKGKQG
jgi:hypothetical protein